MSSRGNAYPARVHYEYELDENVRVQYAHGVWGGVTKHGEIELNFYLEHDKVACKNDSSSQVMVQKDAMLPTQYVTRLVHSRVLLNYHTARSILEWLEEKVQTLELEEDERASYTTLGYGDIEQ